MKRAVEVSNQVLTVDEMRQDLDARTLPKSAGIPGGMSRIFGSVQSARDGACRRRSVLDLGLTLMLLAVAMVATVGRADAQSTGPTFSVENSRIDIGEIKSGSEVVATFVFHNEGPTDVKIIRAKPS